MKEHIGFIGLGIMGRPMAKNLLKAGYSLTVYDINPDAVKELEGCGAESAVSPKEAVAKSEVFITMLPNTAIVEQVVLGANGILEGAKPGNILIDMSSITPAASRKIYAKAGEKGVEMLDAPVSGGEPKAIDGTLAVMAGGKEETFERVKGILLTMGGSAVLVGESGSGSVAKLANQIIVNLNIAAVSEAFVLATKAGVEPEKVYQAIRGGLAGSMVLDAKIPLILERNFKPGGRIDINMKDLTNVMDTSHDVGVPLPLSSQLLEIFHALKADGKAGDDHGGIIQYYEKLANTRVEKVDKQGE